jgi:hypothetical protein
VGRRDIPRLKVGIGGAETCVYTNTPDERSWSSVARRIVVGRLQRAGGFSWRRDRAERRGARARAAEVSAR